MGEEDAVANPVRIALVNAVGTSIPPAHKAFHALWPEADIIDIDDFALPGDLVEAGGLTPDFTDRMAGHIETAVSRGAKSVLFTCSAFGSAIEAARKTRDLPILKPDEAMIEAALAAKSLHPSVCPRIAALATFAPTLPSLEKELSLAALRLDKECDVKLQHVPGAIDAWNAGDFETHDRLIIDAAGALPPHDVLMLAQFSMAHTAPQVRAVTGKPVLTSPEAAVTKLRGLF